jgi:hypothetical protein
VNHLHPQQSLFVSSLLCHPELIRATFVNMNNATSMMFFHFDNAFSEMLGVGQVKGASDQASS